MSELHLIEPESLRADARLAAAFTTRTGGVSSGPFESLNLSWSRGDDKACVEENRARLANALGDVELVFANQVHGRTVLKVDARPVGIWSAGEGDALMTDRPGLGLCAQTADCTPILLFDPERPAVAAIHSGWRGTVQQIAAATLEAMAAAYATRPEQVRAAIGPSISKVNYRVGPEVLEQFEALFGKLDEGLIGPRDDEGGAGLDVAEACRRQLIHAGIPETQIEMIRGCTFAERAQFFSSRRAALDGHAGQFGGQVGVIALRP
ncbi:peptidoglycan editing factor PgeF [Maricaulaceae bacterium EIL42A08]|nr:peptidoglycan editing factor PgeF [Maricaulaceae bacterium EIL42A08]